MIGERRRGRGKEEGVKREWERKREEGVREERYLKGERRKIKREAVGEG